MSEDGLKYDGGKLRWDLLPIREVEEVVEVLTAGANKYAPNNWQHVDNAIERYYAAAMRHLSAYRQGEATDTDDDLSHLSHAICNLIFLLYFQNEGVQT